MHTGPNIERDGLIFGYDTHNYGRFYNGPNTTNHLMALNTSFSNTVNTNGKAVAGTEEVNIPTIGKRTVKYVEYYNNHSNSGSLGCCPNLFNYHGGTTVRLVGNQSYTYSIVYKHTGGYTHPNFMYRYRYKADNTYIGEGGLHSTARRTHLGDGWYHAWGSWVTDPEADYGRFYSFLYNYGTRVDRFYVAAISLVQNNSGSEHLIIPPNLLLDPLGFVEPTNSMIDLNKTTTIDVSNISFDTTGQPTFDGTDDFLAVNPGTFPSSWSQPFSIECVMYVPSGVTWYNTGSGTNIIGRGSYTGSWGLFRGGTDNSVYFWMRTGGNTFNPGGIIGRDKFYHITGTWDGVSQAIFYINGNQNSQETSTNVGTTVDNTGNIHIGGNLAFGGSNGQYGEGYYPVMKIYNKTLTPEEVKQNFISYKNRFDI